MVDRVVFDTNIWTSGLLWRGKPYQCLLLARAGIVQPVYCQAMMAELSQLRAIFGFSENRIQAFACEFRRMSEQIEITGGLHVVADDPDDDKFIECALQAGAGVIVSGDHHLFDIGEYERVCILSAADFVARYS
jgi:putative PIN family toxin of toxin-antitoxin system